MSRTWHHGDKAKKRRFGDTWHWVCNYPKWWDVYFHTKPRRAAEKRALQKELRGDENVVHPLNHKPHRYYW